MSVAYTYPGVYIQELPSPVHTIAGVATSITAFVGYTSSGIDNRAQAIFSFADFERLFGGLAANSELSYAVQQFYLNGGSQAYVVRVPLPRRHPREGHGRQPHLLRAEQRVVGEWPVARRRRRAEHQPRRRAPWRST